jgi:hypothetical protein
LVGLCLLIAAAAGCHPCDSPLGLRRDLLLLRGSGRVHVSSGRKHDLRGRRLRLRGRRLRGLGGLGSERARAEERRGGNKNEAGRHDRLLHQDPRLFSPASFPLAFHNWLRLLEESAKLGFGKDVVLSHFP